MTEGTGADATAAPLLELRGVTVAFGGVMAVQDLSLTVPTGAIVGLVGPNGAGKTTTLDAISGFVPHRGKVLLAGEDLSSLPPHRRARRGLARTWQSLELFDDLTVRENCLLAEPATPVGVVADAVHLRHDHDEDVVERALALLDLTDVAESTPEQLSLGRRKLAAVARALAARPRLLLLDEPAAGLGSDESLALGERLRTVRDEGVTILLVDHDMALVLGLCDEVAVLDFGRLLTAGTPAEIRADERVVEAYLGTTHGGPGRTGTDA